VTVVELFAGPGGWSTGLRLAGYTGPAVGLEWDLPACRTAVAAGHTRICADVSAYPVDRFTNVEGLIASPPCQSFSAAGNGKGLADPRGRLVWEPLRWARVLLPRWIACEQVPRVLPIWDRVAGELRKLGYSAEVMVLNAADFGVPQTRIRAFLVARRDGVSVTPPTTTHCREGGIGLFGDSPYRVSMAEALGSPQAFHVRSNYGTGGDPKKRGIRYSWQPATTVTSKIARNVVVMADGSERRFTMAEAGILQSFPADYPWRGTHTQQQQQVGDAVPPLLAMHILTPLIASVRECAA
jgi:DNA (cytosine-5)-methyltransferase 1